MPAAALARLLRSLDARRRTDDPLIVRFGDRRPRPAPPRSTGAGPLAVRAQDLASRSPQRRSGTGLLARPQQPSTAEQTRLVVRRFPDTPAPLGPDVLRALALRRLAAEQDVRRAELEAARGRAGVETDFRTALADLVRRARRQSADVVSSAADRGLVFSGAHAGLGVRRVEEDRMAGERDLRLDRARRLEQLALAVQEARRRRARELAEIEAERARARSALDALLGLGR